MKNLSEIKEVKTIEYYSNVEEEINKLLKEGWVLLHIGEDFREGEGGFIIYTLGRGNEKKG